ncbi:uncharacterized protein LOC142612364 [Castanea sativa]|uniref:uncharacterized protein LOC142612364 n=1 Tax=Castanea sativa TaxID=21020 RepID=UPI003F64DA12
MIVGGTATAGSSKKARKTYLRTVQNIQLIGSVPKMTRVDNPFIGFSEEDARRLHHPHDDALVVTIQAEDYNIHQVLVDNGSSADILYYLAFQQMGIDRKRLIPTNAPLVGFEGTRVFPLGTVTLVVTIGDYPEQITRNVAFLVVDWSSAYNAIIGRPTLNLWKAITSTYHLMLKFLMDYGVGELREDQVVACECYVAMMEMDNHLQTMSIEEHWAATEPIERLGDVSLNDSRPERITKISTLASWVVRQALTTFLKENQDRGIKANPDKIRAIMEMTPPKNVKEVQSLNGKIAALNRFVSRATNRCLPFFRMLKKSFEWTVECQQVFEDLKAYLSLPPLLSPSQPGEELFLYLAVSPAAVNATLVREDDKVQRHVCYAS